MSTMTDEQKLALDMARVRELMERAAVGCEPNWRSMMTEQGAAVQDSLRRVWWRMEIALRSEASLE